MTGLYSNRMRDVLGLAEREAHTAYHSRIDERHLLIALIREGTGVACSALKNLHFDLRQIRIRVERQMTPGIQEVPGGNLPYTPEARRIVLQYARGHAQATKSVLVRTEHLLLALFDEGRNLPIGCLTGLGLTPKMVALEGNVARQILLDMGLSTPHLMVEVCLLHGDDMSSVRATRS